MHPTLKAKTATVFEYSDLEKLVKEVYGQEIHILQDMIPDERIGQYTYHRFTVDGEEPLDMIGDEEIVRVWTETGQLVAIDISNDPQWEDAWGFELGNVEVNHILYRLHQDGYIEAGEYYMLVSW